MQFKEGHIGECTNLAEEACVAGFHRAMALTSVAEWLRAWDTLTMFEATVCGRS